MMNNITASMNATTIAMNNSINNTTIIAISTDKDKAIRNRIHVFNSVLLGNKKPGDLIKRGRHELKVYGAIHNNYAEFGGVITIDNANCIFGSSDDDNRIGVYRRSGNTWICEDRRYYHSVKNDELVSMAKNDIECIFNTGLTVLEYRDEISADLALE